MTSNAIHPTLARHYPLDALTDLELLNVQASLVTYQGRSCLRLIEADDPIEGMPSLAILTNSDFQDGIIEAEIAGAPRADAPAAMRGFVGLGFRVQPHATAFENFYLRPTNGRANDQLRRNHATQYCAHPDYPWYRLREETPGVYESYVDLVTGAWTKVKIVVTGLHFELYVHDADQPCLIVNDLKLGETRGQIALWIGYGTEAHFASLTVR